MNLSTEGEAKQLQKHDTMADSTFKWILVAIDHRIKTTIFETLIRLKHSDETSTTNKLASSASFSDY